MRRRALRGQPRQLCAPGFIQKMAPSEMYMPLSAVHDSQSIPTDLRRTIIRTTLCAHPFAAAPVQNDGLTRESRWCRRP